MKKPTPDETNSKSRPGLWKRILLNRWVLIVAGLLALYSLIGFLLTPWLITHFATDFVVEKLHRKLSIAEVHTNPFLFTLEVKGFKFDEADGHPIFDFKRFFVNFQLSSLFRWAWTFADIQLDKPALYLEIRKRDGRLNLAALSDDLPKSQKKESPGGPAPRLLVQHIQLANGNCSFTDQTISSPTTQTFENLNLELDDISTLPDRIGPYSAIATLPGGGTIGWQGDISLKPLVSEGELSISDFMLATAWELAKDKLNVDKPAGGLSFTTRYRFDYHAGITQLVLKDAKLALKALSLVKKGDSAPMFSLSAFEASNMHFDLQARELLIPSVKVQSGKVLATVDEQGIMNWQNLMTSANSGKKTSPNNNVSTSETRPWTIKVNGVNIGDVAVNYTDRSRTRPLALTAGGLNILLTASAEIGAGPVKCIVDGLNVKLNNVVLSEAGNKIPVLSLEKISLDNSQIDIGEHKIALTRIGVTGGETRVVRNPEGKIVLADLFTPRVAPKNSKISKNVSKTKNNGTAWAFKLDTFELKNHQVKLRDESLAQAIVYDLQKTHVLVKNIDKSSEKSIDFELAFDAAQGGNVALNGQLSQSADHMEADTKINGLALEPLGPLVDKYTYLKLESGNVSESMHVSYQTAKSSPRINVDGSMDVDGLRLMETQTGDRFLEWKSMSAKSIKYGGAPQKLQINEVKLVEPGAKIMIFKDRSVNLTKIIKHPDNTTDKTAKASTRPASAASKEKQVDFPVSIKRVRIVRGVVDYADLSLVLPFATRVTHFRGGAANITSNSATPTRLKFDGKVGPFGRASVKGGLTPFAPKVYTDITVVFQNVEMTPLSPYTATFAGRKISSGILNLNLEYKIKNSELLGNNSVVLDKFTLGERVKSPGALKLPLDLAIALLTDKDGKIDVAVPVRGNLDDPHFQYGRVILKAIVNLITKIVTSPFKALGGLFGGKGDQVINEIAFDPGSRRLQASELGKLQKVAEVLEKRPQLKLVVQGRFDPKVDGEALRKARILRAIAKQMGTGPRSSGEEPEMIKFDNAKTQRALEKQLEIKKGKDANADFEAQYEKPTGKKAKPLRFYMAILGKKSSDTEYYRAMFEELVKSESLNEKDLVALGSKRAEVIVKTLINTKKLDNTRVTAGSVGPAEESSAKTVDTRLNLEVLKSASNQ